MHENGEGLAVFRSVLPDLVRNGIETTGGTVRPPVYVPNVVDNLWEWRRPAHFPSRRVSAFASPTAALARKSGPRCGRVYKVVLSSDMRACQSPEHRNARDHDDVSFLPIMLYERLGSAWLEAGMSEKTRAGRLWLPCLSKGDVDALFSDVHELRVIVDQVRAAVSYWNDVRLLDSSNHELDDDGEVFFEAPNGYKLVPVD